MGNECCGSFGPVADRIGVRVLLRLSGRGHGSMGTDTGTEHDTDPAAHSRPELHPRPGPGRSRDQLAASATFTGAVEAVLSLLCLGQHAFAEPGACGLDRAVQG